VTDVTVKEGSTGALCFVVVQHEYRVGDELTLSERQDLVFRGVKAAGSPAAAKASGEPAEPSVSRSLVATAPLLFRYSALTFNGHRIHYDRRYCIEEENYPGLVVHGPLQATLLLHLAIQARGATPSRFRFRGVAPLFDGEFSINAQDAGPALKLWSADPSGRATMTAEAHWR
jgi:3-methylfumaryl-CoA hydratase